MIQTNFFPQPKKDEPIKIIQIDPSGLQPRKLEEVLPEVDILPDTYVIYSNGGYHPFYGVPNTLPRYQLPNWPFVKRIKFSEKWGKKEHLLQINPFFQNEYVHVSFERIAKRRRYRYTTKKGKEVYAYTPKTLKISFHRLIALAYIPNPEKNLYVLHNNNNSSDYNLKNLKWGTHTENMRGAKGKAPDSMEQKYLNMINKGIIKE